VSKDAGFFQRVDLISVVQGANVSSARIGTRKDEGSINHFNGNDLTDFSTIQRARRDRYLPRA